MKQVMSILCIFVAAIWIYGNETGRATPAYTISGKITDYDNPSVAKEGFLVRGEPGGLQTTTDANGIYTFQVDEGWTGEVFGAEPNFMFVDADAHWNEKRYVTNIDANQMDMNFLTRPTYQISGRVTNNVSEK